MARRSCGCTALRAPVVRSRSRPARTPSATVRIIGLSGGGPYALAAGAAMPDRVHGVGVLVGVAPTRGLDATTGGAVQLAVRLAPVLSVARLPLSVALTQTIRITRPLAGPALDLYAAVQPPGDKNLLSRPESKAMFLDDLLNGSLFPTLGSR